MNVDEILQHFRPDGSLSQVLSGYQHRVEQAEMAAGVAEALAGGEIGFFEAGTGTGKSLAYLIPAAMHALRSDKPVVVSTYTISLQEQLVTKDIPVVRAIFPELRSVMVKGWSNYVCRLRLQAALETPPELFGTENDQELHQIVSWAGQTEDGTRSDLPFEPSYELWGEVCAESDSCLRAKCPYYSECHLFRDRAAMAKAHVIVVNHHLLFADMAIRRESGWESDQAVLPSYEVVVLDEAHHVEDVATTYMGASASSLGATQLFGRLARRRGDRRRGLVFSLQSALYAKEKNVPPTEFSAKPDETVGTGARSDEYSLVERAEAAVQQVMDDAHSFVLAADAQPGFDRMRIPPGRADEWELRLAPAVDEAVRAIGTLQEQLSEYRQRLDGSDDPWVLSLTAQTDAANKRLQGLAAVLIHFSSLDTRESVYWIERSGRSGRNLRLVSAPVDVGPALLEWIDAQCQSLIFVSATLAVRNSFSYVRERLGLEGSGEIAGRFPVRECLVSSPFDYETQALLSVVEDLPEPTAPAFSSALPECLDKVIRASGGRALILFTSFAMLSAAARSLHDSTSARGLRLLVQGEIPRSRLLAEFRHSDGAVLLGTDTFWEGIDVVGDALSVVVVTKLPFDVPTDPLTVARSERLKQLGRSAFAEYALPRAALKLKQGFGRLIRSNADKGVVVLCDRRIKTKSYGRYFLECLPRCRRIDGCSELLAQEIARFVG